MTPTFRLANDLPIHRLGYGAMRITGEGVWGPPKDKAEAIRVLRETRALDIDFIDTADSYGPYVSEELIAEALYPYEDDLIIATKAGLERTGPNQWPINGRPEHLEEACKGSLKRLKLEQIPLYQWHRFDPDVPSDESLDKLKELQQQGDVKHLGLSEVSIAQIEKAQKYFEVVSVQNKFSLTDRKWADELDWCAERDIAFIPWYPLDAGKVDDTQLQAVADKHGKTIYQIALAWLLHYRENILLIPGTSSVAHLRENTAAGAIRLDAADMELLNAT